MLRLGAVVIRCLASVGRSRRELLLENIALRQQLATMVQLNRPRIRPADRVFWIALRRVWSRWAEVLVIVKPETVVGWHRAGFRLYWQRLSRRGLRRGRPVVPGEVRDLIRRMATENQWRAPRIHGELLRLGFNVSERTVSRYLRGLPSRPDSSLPGAGPTIRHPDVRRMLMTMRAYTEGCRAMALVAAAAHDTVHVHPDAAVRRRASAFYEFLVPLVKGLSTEMSVEVASLGIQVHGGTGYIEESGAPQCLRDARILPIYEGTTAIQANDLFGRKTLRDRGETARIIAADVEECQGALRAQGGPAALAVARRLDAARRLDVVNFVVANAPENSNAVFAGSVPYLFLAGQLVAGWQLARALLADERLLAEGEDVEFMRAKIATARFFADHVLSGAPALRDRVLEGAPGITDMPLDAF